jgi:DNA-binding XRE family transcriptional regulator
MKDYKKIKSTLLKDKDVKKAYDELGPEFAIIEKLIEKRIEQGMTQTQLAELVGTKQAAISRFESGTYNPSVSFLFKIADALGAKMTVNVS